VVRKFLNTVLGLIQWALHTVETWCDKVRLSVNPDKTRLIVFTRKGKLPGFSEPHYFGVTLCRSVLVKYIGIVLDSRLTCIWMSRQGRVTICCGPVEGLWCKLGTKTQGGQLALGLYH